MKREKSTQRGFTLWELLLVLSLMGVLVASITPHFSSATSQIRNRVDLANVTKIEGAAQLYRIDVGVFPMSVSDLVHPPLGVTRWCGPYLDEVPKDPFNSDQSYQLDAMGRIKGRGSP